MTGKGLGYKENQFLSLNYIKYWFTSPKVIDTVH